MNSSASGVDTNATKKHSVQQLTCGKPALVDSDTILREFVGPCGWWQWGVVILLTLSTSSISTFPVYANSASPHRCKMEPPVETFIQQHNLSFDVVASSIGPWRTENNHNLSTERSEFGCFRYLVSWENVSLEQVFLHNASLYELSEGNLQACPLGYVHESSPFHYPGNVVAEFETVCEFKWLVPLGTSLYMFGMLIGFIVGGWCGGIFGRKRTILGAALLQILAGIWTSLSPNYISYVLARTVMGVGTTAKISMNTVLVIEITLAKYRSLFCGIMGLGVNFIFRAVMALFAYYIPDWRWLNMAVFCPEIFCLSYCILLPESPRWLVSKNRIQEALNVLRSGYCINHYLKPKTNRKEFDEYLRETEEKLSFETDTESKTSSSKNGTILKYLFKMSYFKLILISSITTGCMVMALFGLLLYARAVWNYVYLVGFLNSTTAIPATLFSVFIYGHFTHRKKPLIAVNAIASVFLAVGSAYTVIVKPVDDLLLTICSNIGLVFVTTSVYMCYVYMPELFPSEIRSQAFGLLLGLARLGSIASTFLNELDYTVAHGLPVLIVSIILLFVCVFLIALPDATGEGLPDEVDKSHE